MSSLPYGSLQLEHRAADAACEALAKCGQGMEPAGPVSPSCGVVRSLHVVRSLSSVTSWHPVDLHGLRKDFRSGLAGRPGYANRCCRPGKLPWMQAARLQRTVRNGAAFALNKVRTRTKADYRFHCRSTFSSPQEVTVKMWRAAPLLMPSLPTTISDSAHDRNSTRSELRYHSLVATNSTATNPKTTAAIVRARFRRSELDIPKL